MLEMSTGQHKAVFAAPRLSETLMPRGRFTPLIDHPPVLISVWATAGAGKTTLLASWAEELRLRGQSVAWINMAAARSDDQSLEALVGQAFEGASDDTLARTIFIDDAHLVSGHRDRLWLSQLASDPTPEVRAIIAGRYQPVPMTRTPNGPRSVELRSGDLAFTGPEAASFFERRKLELSSAQLKKVLERTDGWAVALAMMADRLENTNDVDRFIDDFSGDHRSVADYLVTEVLARQPDARKRFLMQTSVVEQLTVPLAVHLTGRSNAGELLDELEQENTLVRKDAGQSPTFHYHALLRSHLQAQLQRHDYADAKELHRSAAEWFKKHGRPDVALQQAMSTDDPADVTRILEVFGTSLIFAGKAALVRRALRATEDAGASSATTDVLEVLLAAPNFFDRVAANHHLQLVGERTSTLPPHLQTVYAALVAMRASSAKDIDNALAQLDVAEAAMALSGLQPMMDEATLDAKIFAEAARGCAEFERGNAGRRRSFCRQRPRMPVRTGVRGSPCFCSTWPRSQRQARVDGRRCPPSSPSCRQPCGRSESRKTSYPRWHKSPYWRRIMRRARRCRRQALPKSSTRANTR